MSTEQLPSFESLAPQVWVRIAFFAGTSSVLGPPTDLLALLSTSRKLYDVLSFTKNKQLWADIFKFKFDTDAAARRLSARWSTSKCLAEEGRKRFAAMRRIRHEYNAVTEQHHLSDLWTAYLMLLENDGRNESQLVEWSDIRRFLYHVIIYRARTPQGSSSLWFVDTEGTALTVWLLWMTANAGASQLCDSPILYSILALSETTRDEHPQLRAELRALLHPFVVAGFRVSIVFYAVILKLMFFSIHPFRRLILISTCPYVRRKKASLLTRQAPRLKLQHLFITIIG